MNLTEAVEDKNNLKQKAYRLYQVENLFQIKKFIVKS